MHDVCPYTPVSKVPRTYQFNSTKHIAQVKVATNSYRKKKVATNSCMCNILRVAIYEGGMRKYEE